MEGGKIRVKKDQHEERHRMEIHAILSFIPLIHQCDYLRILDRAVGENNVKLNSRNVGSRD